MAPPPRQNRTLAVPVSPPGRGAVAMIHVSGPAAAEVVERLLAGATLPPPGRTRHAWLHGPDGERLDDALLVSEGPETSLTGCPLVELGIHGGPAVLGAVLRALQAAGAKAGEWKHLLEQGRRNKALDSLRMAAHRRLARTVSRRGAALLACALSGDLHDRLRRALMRDDRDVLQSLLEASREATAWLRPLRVVLTGPPNAGKSTLFNAYLGWERATVSREAGTTRDAVEEDLLVDDRPMRLVDTAGDTAGGRPAAPVKRARVVVHLVDGSEPGPAAESPGSIEPSRLVRVVNKVDRLTDGVIDRFPADWIRVSARERRGLEELTAAIFAAAGQPAVIGRGESGPGPRLFTRRDLNLLESALGPGAGATAARRALLARTARIRASSPDSEPPT